MVETLITSQLLSFNLEVALLRRLLSKHVHFECSLSLAEEVRARRRRANRLMILPNDSDNNEGGGWEGWRANCKTDLYDKQLVAKYSIAQAALN